MVMAAQKWVNATYAGVSGYVAVDENGRTGWSTMYALTRALQHELGMTALSNTFGPGTLSALTARGGVLDTESNGNIVKIVQSACFCKGYNAGAIDGAFGNTTLAGVTNMARNMGVYSGDLNLRVISPKVMKAMLTMDAYIVVAGGTQGVREIQQWMNQKYISRTNFYIVPCDGIFSRDIQKALYLAIQFEIGMTDDQATGTFGPGTKAGLNSHPLSEGASSIWVQLFTAALVVNSFYVPALDRKYSKFTVHYDADVSQGVRAFQSFSQLPVNGTADFATWCQLLASTGDPDRPGTAADCSKTVTVARAQALKAAGYTTIGRYLENVPDDPNDNSTPLNKKLQPGELDIIFGAGLKVFPIFQWGGSTAGYFTYARGWDEGLAAHHAAVGYGFDPGTVIYFAVDYDATQAEIDAQIVPYFRGVAGALTTKGNRFVHGVYGSRNVCSQVSQTTYARWSFVSGMSTGFSGNMGFALPENWAFNQIQTKIIGSGDGTLEIDKDVYRKGTDRAVTSVNSPATPITALLTYIDSIYALAVSFGSGDPNLLTLQYLRYHEYGDTKFKLVIGDYNRDFIDWAEPQGPLVGRRFNDPVYGVSLKTSHIGVAAEGFVTRGQISGVDTNAGDLVGWGGDWINFYAEWRLAAGSYASGYAYCMAKLAKMPADDDDGGFKLRDMIEDVDGYNIARKVKAGQKITDVFREYYGGDGFQSRFHQFIANRFGTAAASKDYAKDMLMGTTDNVVDVFRLAILAKFGDLPALPESLPSSTLAPFLSGFADTLGGLSDNETGAVSKARALGRI
jgi:peptidoglycan hydrolase-like protein with peptidoglycan-binding domain